MTGRQTLGVCIVGTVLMVMIGCGRAKPTVPTTVVIPAPKATFTVSKETTFFTEPLDKDGYIDYETAVNERLRGKTKPDDNAVVLLIQALGPKPEGSELPASFYHWLGVQSPPPQGDYLIGYFRHFPDEQNNNHDRSFVNSHSVLSSSAWKAEDDPKHAEWLKANEKPLAIAVQASKRAVYYHPVVRPDRGARPGLLLSAPLSVSAKVRELAWMLSLRATLHAGEGRDEEAWADLFAAFRLGRLVSHGASQLESVIGSATEQLAMQSTVALLEDSRSSKSILARRDEFLKLPARGALADKLALASRVSFLDLTTAIYRDGLQVLTGIEDDNMKYRNPDDVDERLRVTVDWNTPLKAFQHWFDRFAAAHNKVSQPERAEAWSAIKIDLEEKLEQLDFAAIREEAKKNDPASVSPEFSKKFADVLVSRLMPNTPMASEACYRAEQNARNLSLAFALTAYHADHKKYPAALADLAPKYIDKIPGDLFSDKPLIYKPTDAGYLLYSVGVNGIDDDGKTYGEEPPGDDLIVRMPFTKPK